MKKFCRIISLVSAFALLPACSFAQRIHTTDTTERFNYNINLETGVYSGLGNTHAYTLVAPTFEYAITPKVKAFGGVAFANDVNTSLYHLRKFNENTRSYAPRRNGTRSAAIHGGAIIQPNDHLTITASAFYIGGQYDPLWNFSDHALQLNAYGFSASMSYQFKNNNSLNIYVDFVRDKAGTLLNPYLYDYLGFGTYSPWHQSPFIGDPTCYPPLF